MEIQYRTELPQKKALFALYEHLMWNDSLKLSQDQLMEAMKGSIFSVYAYCGNQLVGTGRVVSDGTISAYLCGLGVHSDYRNRGIGTAMMKRLCQFCTDRRTFSFSVRIIWCPFTSEWVSRCSRAE